MFVLIPFALELSLIDLVGFLPAKLFLLDALRAPRFVITELVVVLAFPLVVALLVLLTLMPLLLMALKMPLFATIPLAVAAELRLSRPPLMLVGSPIESAENGCCCCWRSSLIVFTTIEAAAWSEALKAA